jgi:isocitrate dehydrogenase
MKTAIAVAEGDGIGPEIVRAVFRILSAAGAELVIHKVELGESHTWETLSSTRALLKGPITFSSERGMRDFYRIFRTLFGFYANVSSCISYFPFLTTKQPDIDLVIIRELTEDLYTGIEYQQTPNVCTALKLISRVGSEQVIQYAFAYAERYGRKKVSCFTQSVPLKRSDGLFYQVFEEIAKEYSTILNEHWSVDRGAAHLADTPQEFDLIVLPNFYGEILSQIAVKITGSSAICSSSYIGKKYALFEAVQGNDENPSALLYAAIQMLLHIDQVAVAECIHNALLKTLEEVNAKKRGNKELAEKIIKNLGRKPEILRPVSYYPIPTKNSPSFKEPQNRRLIGIDVTIYHQGPLSLFFSLISHISIGPLKLRMIANRGIPVWPQGNPETVCIEQWLCRFTTEEGHATSQNDLIRVVHAFDHVNMEVIKTDFLYAFEGKAGYPLIEGRL